MWAEQAGFRPWSMQRFGRKMHERFERKRVTGGVVYLGIRLLDPATGIQVPKAKVAPMTSV
jgi:hypothetical protein